MLQVLIMVMSTVTEPNVVHFQCVHFPKKTKRHELLQQALRICIVFLWSSTSTAETNHYYKTRT